MADGPDLLPPLQEPMWQDNRASVPCAVTGA